MSYSWEILKLVARTERQWPTPQGQAVVREHHDERATRVCVIVDSHCGVATAFHGPEGADVNELIDLAVLDAARHPAKATSSEPTGGPSPLPPVDTPVRADLMGLSWLAKSGKQHLRIEYSLDRADEPSLNVATDEHWRDLTVDGYPVARVSVDAPTIAMERPEWDPACWLIPPHVLSQLMMEPMLNAIVGRSRLRKWPAGTLFDPGWGGGFDYEGNARLSTVFSQAGTLLMRATDRRTAWAHGLSSTGHAGLTGPVVRDLVVAGNRPADDAMPPGTLVAGATCLAREDDGRSPVLGLRLVDKAGGALPPVVVTLDDLADLLDAGNWHGPCQRGIGPWTSRWLAIGVPNPYLRPHHQ